MHRNVCPKTTLQLPKKGWRANKTGGAGLSQSHHNDRNFAGSVTVDLHDETGETSPHNDVISHKAILCLHPSKKRIGIGGGGGILPPANNS